MLVLFFSSVSALLFSSVVLPSVWSYRVVLVWAHQLTGHIIGLIVPATIVALTASLNYYLGRSMEIRECVLPLLVGSTIFFEKKKHPTFSRQS